MKTPAGQQINANATDPTRYEHELDEIREQRDALLVALKLAATKLADLSYRLDVRVDSTYDLVQAAIAKAEL